MAAQKVLDRDRGPERPPRPADSRFADTLFEAHHPEQGAPPMRNLSLAFCVAAAFVPALAQGQPHAVGLTEFQIADPEGLRPLDVQLLYPAEQGGQSTSFGGNGARAQFEVQADAPMAAGRFPLVLISHGLYGMASNYGWLTTELAANGMIVASPVHPGTAWTNKDSSETPKLWQRPRDLSRMVTYLSDDPTWRDAIDADHIAAIGHSLGGFTVMALAGARFDTARYQRYCDAHSDRADCRWYRRAEVGREAHAQLEQSLADPRVGAVVSLDLGFTQAFSPESVSAIDIPVLVIGAGSHLPDLPVDAESRHLAKMLPEATTIYLESDEITHFTFFSACRPGAIERLIAVGEGDEMICKDGGGRDRAALHAELLGLIKRFLEDAGFGTTAAG
jgi:predicted dienelactone hydrolase